MVIEVIDDTTTTMYRAMTPGERLASTSKMFRTAKILAAAGVRLQHPDCSEEFIRLEVLRRLKSGTT
jgi:hypothetical protein